jgi:hypothetical protein
MALSSLPKSPVSSSLGDEVPHIFIRKTHLQPSKFLISSGKRLLQQNRERTGHYVGIGAKLSNAVSLAAMEKVSCTFATRACAKRRHRAKQFAQEAAGCTGDTILARDLRAEMQPQKTWTGGTCRSLRARARARRRPGRQFCTQQIISGNAPTAEADRCRVCIVR